MPVIRKRIWTRDTPRRMNVVDPRGWIEYPYNRVPQRSSKRYRNRFGRYEYRSGYYSPTLMLAAGMGHSHAEYLHGIYRARRELPRHVNRHINEYLGNP